MCWVCQRRCAPACSTSTGCSRTRRACTRRPGKSCSTTSFGSVPSARARSSSRSTLVPTTSSTWTAREREDGVRSFLASRGIELPEGDPDDRPAPRRCYGLGNRKNELFQQDPAQRRRRGLRRIAPLPRGGRRRGSRHRGGVVERQHPRRARSDRARQVRPAAGRRRDDARREHRRQAGTRLLPAGRAAARCRPRRGGGLRGRTLRGGGRAARATSASWSASTGSVRQRRCGATAPTSWSPTSPSCCRDDHRRRVPGRALACPRDPRSTSTCWLSPSRCSPCRTGTSACAATSTRANPTACRAPTSNSFYEIRPLPYAEAGYGYPEDGQTIVDVTNGKIMRLLVDDEPFDVRYGELLEHERVLDMRAGTLTRTDTVALPGRQAGQGACPPGWCRSPNAAWPPSSTWSRRSTSSSA